MKKIFSFFLIFFIFAIYLQAQLTVVSSNPTNNSVGIDTALNTISITFNSALDTVTDFQNGLNIISNFFQHDIIPAFTSDSKTVIININLLPDSDYFIALFGVKAADGTIMDSSVVINFTTANDFTGFDVSGKVSTDNPSFSSANTLVALSSTPFSDKSLITNASFSDSNGNYLITNVKDGVYYPIAAKDMNGDGKIESGINGDITGQTDSIIVSGANVGNVNITLITNPLISFSDARVQADNIKNTTLPAGTELYFVQSYFADSVGKSDSWEFDYINSSEQQGYEVDISVFGQLTNLFSDSTGDDTGKYSWISGMRPLGNFVFSAAEPDSFVINARINGAADFLKNYPMGDSLQVIQQLMLGNLSKTDFRNSGIPDPNAFYWGYELPVVSVNTQNWSSPVADLQFIANYEDGTIITITDVKSRNNNIPKQFKLEQNYPNPFNPATTIKFSIPIVKTKHTLSVQLKIYDVLGREVSVLVNKKMTAGNYQVNFNADNLPSGLYFYRLTVGKYAAVKKMMLLK